MTRPRLRPAFALTALLLGAALLAACADDEPEVTADPEVPTATTTAVAPSPTPEATASPTATVEGETVETAIGAGGVLEDLEVSPGDTVIWTNEDDEAHTITSVDSIGDPLDSGEIAPGATFEHTFSAAGVWDLVVDGGDDIWVVVAE